MMAQHQRRFEEAEAHYCEALELELQFDDRYGAARTYHQLGMMAQTQRRFDDAQGTTGRPWSSSRP